jgi:hypothetical protein
VIVYQPGEYQPNALDDLDGNNFQILANSTYFAAYRDPESAVPGVAPLRLWGLGGALATLGSRVLRKRSHAWPHVVSGNAGATSRHDRQLNRHLEHEARNLEFQRKSD